MQLEVKDGRRTLQFDGELLAEASSDDGRAQRWIDIKVYKTDQGKFVVSKIGRSTVYHGQGHPCSSGVVTRVRDITIPERENLSECRRCRPGDVVTDGLLQQGSVTMEQDRHSAHVVTTAEGLVAQMHNSDENGTVYLTNVAKHALELASEKDPAISQAFLVQRV